MRWTVIGKQKGFKNTDAEVGNKFIISLVKIKLLSLGNFGIYFIRLCY